MLMLYLTEHMGIEEVVNRTNHFYKTLFQVSGKLLN